MQTSPSKNASIQEETKNILDFISQRKAELERTILNYKNEKVIDVAINLIKLYSDFKYFLSEKKDIKNHLYIINLIQIEIDSKEWYLKYLKSELWKSNFHQLKLVVPKWDPKWIEVFNEVIEKTKVTKKYIEDYISKAHFWENKDKIMSLVFAWYKDVAIKEDDLVESFHEANAIIDTFVTRFWALQFAKAFSFIDILTFRLWLLDMNELTKKLNDSGYKNIILDLPNWISRAFEWFEKNPSFKQSNNFYFFWLVKEFHKIMTWNDELSQDKEPMFSPEITAVIIERIKKIESIYWDINLFD
ncbi:MAG: hypothetical protein ACD_49C00066G0010 [uncultured bacterium (gcode 4)]|uniref:Uncharacterized protein n=1 Tax=uncultured bacterium (gcode 4) TaxID=1234023 RepID=K2AWL1_9BACT|nr:MAG: hypothetical protein ACD_49C00066G0010 [uncultured bacterium (gcode 4)]